jgi:hypothetical protein
LKELAAENPWPKRLLAEMEPEKDTLQGLTKGNLWARHAALNDPRACRISKAADLRRR